MTALAPHGGRTIDELARAAGMTTRNVRAYQERGLLPAPTRVGRTGYYDEGHLARLGVISSLLERGYSLAAIRDLLAVWARGGDVSEVLGLEQALVRPFLDEQPVRLTLTELIARFPADDPDALRRAGELGIIELDGDAFVVPSTRLLEAGAALVRAGVPIHAVLDEAAAVGADVEAMAKRFVTIVTDHVFAPFAAGDVGSEELHRITELVEQLRPLAAQVVMSMLARAMEHEVRATARAALELLGGAATKEPAAS